MAELKRDTTVTLTEVEAMLMYAVFQHVRLGHDGWNSIASNIVIALEPHFADIDLPNVEFSFEDRNGREIKMNDIDTIIEVGDRA